MKAAKKQVSPEDKIKQEIIKEMWLYDWKLGVRGEPDDEYFVNLQSWINNAIEIYEMNDLIQLLFSMQNLNRILPKPCGCDYKSIYDILTNSNPLINENEDEFWANTFAIYFKGEHSLEGDTMELANDIEKVCKLETSHTANHINIHIKYDDVLYAKIMKVIKKHKFEVERLDKNEEVV